MNGETLRALVRRPCFWIAVLTMALIAGDETGGLAKLHVDAVFVKWAERVLIGLAVWFPGVGAVIHPAPAVQS